MGYDHVPLTDDGVWVSLMNVDRREREPGTANTIGKEFGRNSDPVYGMRAGNTHPIDLGALASAAELVDDVFAEHVGDAVHEIDHDQTL